MAFIRWIEDGVLDDVMINKIEIFDENFSIQNLHPCRSFAQPDETHSNVTHSSKMAL